MGKSLLKIGLGKWTGYEPFHLAEKTGIFKKNNANVKLLYNLKVNEEVKDLKSGEIDGAAITLDMAISLINSGFPVKAVLIIDYSIGGDMIISRNDIKTIEDLKGKKIGLEKLYINEYFLARSLAEKKIDKDEINLIYLDKEELKDALLSKQVDAVVAYNPLATNLIQEGIKVLFSTKEIPGSVIDLLVFPTKIYYENQENIKSIVQSWFETLKYIEKDYIQSMKIMAGNEDVPEYEFKLAFDDILLPDLKENLAFFNLESEDNIFKISDITKDFIVKRSNISPKINLADMFDTSILKSIEF